jgi:hypothetical protein
MEESRFFKAAQSPHELEQKKREALKNIKNIPDNYKMTEFGDLVPPAELTNSKQMKLFFNGKDRIVTVFEDGKIYDPSEGIDGEWIDSAHSFQLKDLVD